MITIATDKDVMLLKTVATEGHINDEQFSDNIEVPL
jgi:hypothetical protein